VEGATVKTTKLETNGRKTNMKRTIQAATFPFVLIMVPCNSTPPPQTPDEGASGPSPDSHDRCRLYGPTEAAIDKSWKPGDIENVASHFLPA
jgi:hypothetical protein